MRNFRLSFHYDRHESYSILLQLKHTNRALQHISLYGVQDMLVDKTWYKKFVGHKISRETALKTSCIDMTSCSANHGI